MRPKLFKHFAPDTSDKRLGTYDTGYPHRFISNFQKTQKRLVLAPLKSYRDETNSNMQEISSRND